MIYVPTPPEVVDAMLTIANVRRGDVLYDLGSGDGRIPITAAQKYNVTRATGIEINPERILEAQQNLTAAGVGDRVHFRNEDLFEARLFRRYRDNALPIARSERQVVAKNVEGVKARHAHRFARVCNGRLEAGKDTRCRRAIHLFLDNSGQGHRRIRRGIGRGQRRRHGQLAAQGARRAAVLYKHGLCRA